MLKINLSEKPLPPMPGVGDTVDHFIFGVGKVLSYGPALTLNVKFEGGVKGLLWIIAHTKCKIRKK